MHARMRSYYNDTWAYDLEQLKWAAAGRPGGAAPGARGGCQLAVHGDALFLYGGHTVVVDKSDRSERDIVHDDLWRLDLGSFQVCSAAGSHIQGCKVGLISASVGHHDGFVEEGHMLAEGKKGQLNCNHGSRSLHMHACMHAIWARAGMGWDGRRVECASAYAHVPQWERLKRAGLAPSARASFGMVTHRERALLFGGVTDRPGAGDKMYSELHDELYALDLPSQRWRPVTLRAPKQAAAGKVWQLGKVCSGHRCWEPDGRV
jgi:hypothetical protein